MYPLASRAFSALVLLVSCTRIAAIPVPHDGHAPTPSMTHEADSAASDMASEHQKYTDYVFRFPPADKINTTSLLTSLEPYGFKASHLHDTYASSLNGFSALMSDHCVGVLKDMVENATDIHGITIEPNMVFSNQGSFAPTDIRLRPDNESSRKPPAVRPRQISPSHSRGDEIQSHATWGLQRLSQSDSVSLPDGKSFQATSTNFVFNFQEFAGQGVDIYVLDSGVNHNHKDFNGRAVTGYVAPALHQSEGDEDLNGHGTHCAGTAGSTTYGVAKRANIIGVKVMGREGGGLSSDMIGGIEYMISRHNQRKKQPGFKGSVASMSFGLDIQKSKLSDPKETARATALDEAVKRASAAGIHVVIAAGNQDINACRISPAALSRDTDSELDYSATAITVGASTISDNRADFSNFGGCITTYAPGTEVLSTYIGSDEATAVMQGTSMATPYVAGLVAYFLSLPQNSKLIGDVAGMKKLVMNTAHKGKLGNINDKDDTKLLAFNGNSS